MVAQRARVRALPVVRALAVSAAGCALSGGSVMGGDFVNVVKSGAPVPGQGTTFTGVNLAGVDAAAGTAFVGSFTIAATNYSGLYRSQGGVVTPIADRGTVGPAGETIHSIIGNGDYENGVIVFAANTSAGQAVYRYSPGLGLKALVRQGDVLPGATSPINGFVARGVSGDADNFAFSGPRADQTHGLYASVDDQPLLLVDQRIRVPVVEMGYFVDFPEINYRNGRTVYIGRGQDPDAPGAVVEPAGVFIQSPGNPLEIIAGKFMPIPGAPENMRFMEFERPRIQPDGRVSFAGGFIDEHNPDPSAPHHMGVFIRNPDLTWKKYIDSEMNLPGLHAEVHEFNQYSLESGFNFFGVNDIAGGSYIYYESAAGVFTHLIDTYAPLEGKAVSRIRMLSDTAVGAEVFFRADFTDGTSGIYAVAVPEPASPGVAGGLALVGLARRRRRRRH